jgi:uncharacterized protein YndB with AHSA1/START domain
MNHPFEINEQITVNATPDQVWQAIATGPGIDSWFMGHSEVESREGGRNTMTMFGQTSASTITAWEPGRRFAFRGDADPENGTFMGFEYLVEGRGDGTTVIRFVHSGLLAGDDWESEYDALRDGDPMYLRKLATYVEHFAGRTSDYNILVPGPEVSADRVWPAFAAVLGVTGELKEGAPVSVTVPGLPVDDGVVAFTKDQVYVGVRTPDGMYVLMHGYRHGVFVSYHSYDKVTDEQEIESAWQSWLTTAFA